MMKDMDDFKLWVNASSTQLDRVRISFGEHLTVVQSGDFEKMSLSPGYMSDFSRTSAQLWVDIQFLYVSLNQLMTTLESSDVKEAVSDVEVGGELKFIVNTLRNIFEHQDESRLMFEGSLEMKASSKSYSDHYPSKTPFSISLDDNGFIISGVLKVNEVQMVINKFEDKLIEVIDR